MDSKTGIDVSQYQSSPNWDLVKQNVGYAFIRASYGTMNDPQFTRNWAESKRVGLPRGAYHYYYTAYNAGDQARSFIRQMNGDYGDLPCVIDVEDSTSFAGAWSTAAIADMKWFIEIVEAISGKKPIIYTGNWFWVPKIGSNAPWAKDYPLWIAGYPTVWDPNSKPTVPAPWLQAAYWQYSNKGSIPGINGNVDLDYKLDYTDPPVVYPPITFSASPSIITTGSSTSLSWSVEGVEGVWLDGAGVAGVASKVVTPLTSTAYTLKVMFRDKTTTTRIVTVTVTQAPAPQPVDHKLGGNFIGQTQTAVDASNQGCEMFVLVDNPGTCESIKQYHPSAIVVNRRWSIDSLNGQQQWDKFGASCNTGVINEIFNEQDGNHNYGSASDLRLRIDNEIKYYQIARSRGALVAFGGYSMGTPEFNDPAIIEQLKRYAHYYNTDLGCYFSVHNYSPNMQHIDKPADYIWYETRWQQFFTKCGFNPALRKMLVTETGVDEGGVGGFPAHSTSTAQFKHWCQVYDAAMRAPITVNGVQYASPLLGSAIFGVTAGRDTKWQGYDCTGLISQIPNFYKGGYR